MVKAALDFEGASRLAVGGQVYRLDCSGFVEACHAVAGIDLRGSSADLYELARSQRLLHKRKTPAPGDIAFFSNTYDRNGDGRWNDTLTHVAIVLDVDEEGTIRMMHFGSKGICVILMNLTRPHERLGEDGRVLNDHLRGRSKHDRQDAPTLAAELWIGFGQFWRLPDDRT